MTIKQKGAEFCFVLGRDTSNLCTCRSLWNNWDLFEYIGISHHSSRMLQA